MEKINKIWKNFFNFGKKNYNVGVHCDTPWSLESRVRAVFFCRCALRCVLL